MNKQQATRKQNERWGDTIDLTTGLQIITIAILSSAGLYGSVILLCYIATKLGVAS